MDDAAYKRTGQLFQKRLLEMVASSSRPASTVPPTPPPAARAPAPRPAAPPKLATRSVPLEPGLAPSVRVLLTRHPLALQETVRDRRDQPPAVRLLAAVARELNVVSGVGGLPKGQRVARQRLGQARACGRRLAASQEGSPRRCCRVVLERNPRHAAAPAGRLRYDPRCPLSHLHPRHLPFSRRPQSTLVRSHPCTVDLRTPSSPLRAPSAFVPALAPSSHPRRPGPTLPLPPPRTTRSHSTMTL